VIWLKKLHFPGFQIAIGHRPKINQNAEYFLVKLTLWPIIFADLWQIDRWNFNTIRSAAMFLVWIVFTVAAKVITSRGKCILSVFSPVIPNTIKKNSFCFQQLRPISLVTVQSARPIVARVTNVCWLVP
jgi:hypothetical protein